MDDGGEEQKVEIAAVDASSEDLDKGLEVFKEREEVVEETHNDVVVVENGVVTSEEAIAGDESTINGTPSLIITEDDNSSSISAAAGAQQLLENNLEAELNNLGLIVIDRVVIKSTEKEIPPDYGEEEQKVTEQNLSDERELVDNVEVSAEDNAITPLSLPHSSPHAHSSSPPSSSSSLSSLPFDDKEKNDADPSQPHQHQHPALPEHVLEVENLPVVNPEHSFAAAAIHIDHNSSSVPSPHEAHKAELAEAEAAAPHAHGGALELQGENKSSSEKTEQVAEESAQESAAIVSPSSSSSSLGPPASRMPVPTRKRSLKIKPPSDEPLGADTNEVGEEEADAEGASEADRPILNHPAVNPISKNLSNPSQSASEQADEAEAAALEALAQSKVITISEKLRLFKILKFQIIKNILTWCRTRTVGSVGEAPAGREAATSGGDCSGQASREREAVCRWGLFRHSGCALFVGFRHASQRNFNSNRQQVPDCCCTLFSQKWQGGRQFLLLFDER